MAELGGDKNKKSFLANFNTLQAPPKKRKLKLKKKRFRLPYQRTGCVLKFIPEWKKEFKWLKDTANGMTCNICKSFEMIGSFKVHNF